MESRLKTTDWATRTTLNLGGGDSGYGKQVENYRLNNTNHTKSGRGRGLKVWKAGWKLKTSVYQFEKNVSNELS
jgi:hypothetical protein